MSDSDTAGTAPGGAEEGGPANSNAATAAAEGGAPAEVDGVEVEGATPTSPTSAGGGGESGKSGPDEADGSAPPDDSEDASNNANPSPTQQAQQAAAEGSVEDASAALPDVPVDDNGGAGADGSSAKDGSDDNDSATAAAETAKEDDLIKDTPTTDTPASASEQVKAETQAEENDKQQQQEEEEAQTESRADEPSTQVEEANNDQAGDVQKEEDGASTIPADAEAAPNAETPSGCADAESSLAEANKGQGGEDEEQEQDEDETGAAAAEATEEDSEEAAPSKPKSVRARMKDWLRRGSEDDSKAAEGPPIKQPSDKWQGSFAPEQDRSIAKSKNVGGFAVSQVPLADEAAAALKGFKGSRGDNWLSFHIDDASSAITLAESCSIKGTLADVQSKIHTEEPRYSLLRGKKTVFIYSCPDKSVRTKRMLYSTAKPHVLEVFKKHGVNPAIKLEIADPDDISDDDLAGKKVKAKGAAAAQGPPKAATFARVPSSEAGSLSAFMTNTLGKSAGKKKVVMPPKGAYG